MAEKMFVKPRVPKGADEPLIVRRPEKEHQPLPKDGDWVPRNAYYLRRLRDGDVEKATPPKTTKQTSNKE